MSAGAAAAAVHVARQLEVGIVLPVRRAEQLPRSITRWRKRG